MKTKLYCICFNPTKLEYCVNDCKEEELHSVFCFERPLYRFVFSFPFSFAFMKTELSMHFIKNVSIIQIESNQYFHTFDSEFCIN